MKTGMVLVATLAFAVALPARAQEANPPAPPAPPQAEDATPTGVPLESALFETIVKIPVTVQPIFGDARQGEIIVTHFKPKGDGPFPLVVMNHGRGKDRANPGRLRFVEIARYWTRRGAAVIVPTRLGYGDTGLEPDPEETGPCDSKRYDVPARNMKAQLQAVLDFAAKQPWVDAKRVIVMGQSMGGFATIVYMGQKHPGVVAGINFAGGGGGDPEVRKANPCRYDQMAKVFEDAGKDNAGTTPMLWLYSRNDLYWGEKIPRQWHEAYTSGGGKARFEMLPAVGDDGHRLMNLGRQMWRPIVDAFVEPLGLRAPKSEGAPPATNFAAIDDASKLPRVKQETKDIGYRRFLNADVPRAFAIGPKGEWAFMSGTTNDGSAMKRALERCAQNAKADCRLYAVDDAVVWVE